MHEMDAGDGNNKDGGKERERIQGRMDHGKETKKQEQYKEKKTRKVTLELG